MRNSRRFFYLNMFESAKIQTVRDWLDSNQNIVITSHKSPDGDSVGSSLALMHFLKKIGKSATICHPDKMPDFFEWLDGAHQIITFDEQKENVIEAINQADIIFCLDYNHFSRTGDLQPILEASEAKKIMIDHHQNPELSAFQMSFSYPTISSTSELIYEFVEAFGLQNQIDESIGSAIYTGIMTDTGSFRFPSTTSRTHQIIAHLIDNGVKNHTIHEQVYDVNTLAKIKLNGFAMSEKLTVLDKFNVAYISLSSEELKAYNAGKGDTEGLVNKALSIKGMKMAVFFKEEYNFVKISFRSKGDTFVNELAQNHFSGGGHIYASGGKFEGSISEAIDKLVTLLPEYVNN